MSRGPDDELLPWWWQRQIDPTSPDVVPGPHAGESTTHRNWVLLGTTGGVERAVVDPRGAVTPWPDGWSLDWWVGADDDWHLPSRAAGVRQQLVDASPVVQTTVRIPGGDVVHRAWAVAAGDGVPDGGAVVVELENASPVPVAVAFAIRPFNPLGRVPVSAVTLSGSLVSVDGRPAMLLPKAPSRVAVGSAAQDSVVATVSGEATSAWPEGGARCSAGRASAAFLFPLPHTATVRVLLPLLAARPGASRRRTEVAPTGDPRRAADADRVAAGWEAQSRRAPRLDVPELRLEEAVTAARRFALLHAAGDDPASWPPAVVCGLDTAELCVALDQHGLHDEAGQLVLGFVDRQGLDGSFAGESTRVDAAASWLHALGHHIRLTGDVALAEALVGPVAKAAHHIRRRVAGRRTRLVEGPAVMPPPGATAPWVPLGDRPAYHDALWARRGLLDAAFVLDLAAQPDAAVEPRAVAGELTAALVAALAADRDLLEASGPAADAVVVATAVALGATLTGPEPAPPELVAALAACAGRAVLVRGGVWHAVGDAGLSPRLTAGFGAARAAAGRPDAAEPLAWLLERGAPVWAWPELVHPRSGGGCAGQGHDADATAAFLGFARRLLVHETGGALAVLPALPDAWLGQPVEAHGLPTSHGALSFALRWHGDRPALLWELEPHRSPAVADAVRAAGGFALTAPGLDPSWSSTETSGEALLAAPDRAPAPSDAGSSEADSSDAGGEPLPGAPATPSPTNDPEGRTGSIGDPIRLIPPAGPPAEGGSFS